jgi:hypothetical protein
MSGIPAIPDPCVCQYTPHERGRKTRRRGLAGMAIRLRIGAIRTSADGQAFDDTHRPAA